MTTASRKTQQLRSLQAGRSIAAVLVVLFHMTGTVAEVFGGPMLWGIFEFGFSGVDFFFVLSGFIIAYTGRSVLGKPQALYPYLRRRIVRVYPIYWLLVLPLIAAISLDALPYSVGLETSVWDAIASLFLWFGHTNYNGVSWTLTHEVYFYLAFAIPILSKRLIPVPLLIFAMAGALVYTGSDSKLLAVIADPINIEFLLGVGVAVLLFNASGELRFESARIATAILVAGICAFLCFGLLPSDMAPSSWRLLMFGVPSTLVVCGLVALEAMQRIHIWGWLVTLGNASYVLYLLHLPVVRGANKLASLYFPAYGIWPIVLNGTLLLGLCALSIVIHKLVEKPMIGLLNRALAKQAG